MADRWGLTSQLADVLEFHHDPSASKKFSRECAVVAIAAYMAKRLEAANGEGPEPALPDTKVFMLAGIKLENMELYYHKAQGILDEIEVLADIIVGQG